MSSRWSQFVEGCRTSGVLSEGDLRSLPTPPAAGEAEAIARCTDALVHQGKLTRYQVDELQAGRGARLLRGDYTILEPLGSGGMGRVFKGVHRRMDRVVAIKELPTEAVDSPAARERFHHEVKAAARLIHPHIVTAFDAGEQEGVPYLVMEYVDGQDLATVLKENGELPLSEALSCVLQVARGLDYAHSRGIVHRDIKPGNLLLDWAGNIRILDMGLARFDGHASTQIGPGEIVGTFDYMAPEQAAGQAVVDGRSDIYSLGCTLYRIVTGRPLYAGATPEEKRKAHREAAVPRLADTCAELPTEVETLFQRMVAKDPAQRPATMGRVILELERCLTAARAAPAMVGVASSGTLGGFEESSIAPLEPARPFDQTHESTVVTRAGDELTHPATTPNALPAVPALTAEPVELAPVLSSETQEPSPLTGSSVAALAWPILGIIAAGIAAVAIGAGLVVWLNS